MKMHRSCSPHTPGISKKSAVKPQKKKPLRYFTLEPVENNPLSSSELILKKKKENANYIDVTKQLLSLVNRDSSNSNVKPKESLVNGNVETSTNSEGYFKINSRSPSLRMDEEIGFKEHSCSNGRNKSDQSNEENINSVTNLKLQSSPGLKVYNHKDKIKKKKSKKTKLSPSKYALNENNNVSEVLHNISLSKNIKQSVQDSEIPNGNQLKKQRKKLNSSGKGKLVDEKEQNEDNSDQKYIKTANTFESASVVESNRPISNYLNILKEEGNLRGTQTSSLRYESESKVMVRSCPEKKERSIHSRALSQVDFQNDEGSEKDFHLKDNVQIRTEKPMPKEQNVQNSAEPLQRNISPPKRPRMSAKIKKKLSSTHVENAGMVDFIAKHQQIANSLQTKRKSFEGEDEDHSSLLNVSNNDKKKNKEEFVEETCNSQPIVVEMSGENHVSSSPILYQAPAFRKKNVTPKLNLKSDLNWRSPNIHATEKWEVQYGNTENIYESGTQNSESVNGRSDRNYNEENEMISGGNNSYSEGDRVIENYSHKLYDIFDISDTEAVLAISPTQTAFFKGVLSVKVLVGKISVLGHEIGPTSGVCTVYSPGGASYPGLQSCAKYNIISAKKYWRYVLDTINRFQKNNSLILESIFLKVPAFSSIVLLKRVSEVLLPFLDIYIPQVGFPNVTSQSKIGEDASGTLRALFLDSRSPHFRFYREPSAWDSLVTFLLKRDSGTIRVVACGGKGVGKSTLLRFLTNKTLSKFEEVLYLDFDPGQCEFSIPGCVSATIVRKPLLGPNFTHLTHPERMIYIGDIDVSRCSGLYMQSVKHIYDWCCSQAHLHHLPWFINTMGFAKGLGVDITVAIIEMINPSDLIQIDSSLLSRNYPFVLDSQNVQNHTVSYTSFSHKPDQTLDYAFHLLPSAAETPDRRAAPWGAQANVSRNKAIISYFSKVVTLPALSLLEVVPHKLPFSSLKLCIAHESIKPSDYLLAMNASLVGLCIAENVQSLKPNDPDYPEIVMKLPICHCVGFGIVRGVDLNKKEVYIISPVEPRKLKVNCLVLGFVNLPENVYKFQDAAEGTIPYVIEGALLPLGRGVHAAKKKRMFVK